MYIKCTFNCKINKRDVFINEYATINKPMNK